MAPWINTESSAPKLFSCVQKERGKKRLSPRIPQCYSLIMKARTQHQQQQQQQQNGWKAKRKFSSRSLVVSSSDVWIGMVTIQKWDFPFCDFSAEENEHPNHCQFSRCSSLPEQRFYLIFFFRFVNGTWHTTGYHRVTRRREPRSRWNLDTPQDIDETWDLLSLKRSRPREYWFEWCPHLNQWPANRLREMNWKWPFFLQLTYAVATVNWETCTFSPKSVVLNARIFFPTVKCYKQELVYDVYFAAGAEKKSGKSSLSYWLFFFFYSLQRQKFLATLSGLLDQVWKA